MCGSARWGVQQRQREMAMCRSFVSRSIRAKQESRMSPLQIRVVRHSDATEVPLSEKDCLRAA